MYRNVPVVNTNVIKCAASTLTMFVSNVAVALWVAVNIDASRCVIVVNAEDVCKAVSIKGSRSSKIVRRFSLTEIILAGFEELYCHCRSSVIYPPVPCGTKPPTCDKPCRREHDCDHPPLHTCHSDRECPPCIVFTDKLCYGGHEVRRVKIQFDSLLSFAQN